MSNHKFNSIHDIPDPVPSGLLFSSQRSDLLVPKEAQHSVFTTSPIEIAYCVWEFGAGNFAAEIQLLEALDAFDGSVEERFDEGWGNHVGRAVIRAMLDPDRHAPILMTRIYENELASARYPEPNEELFFEQFVDNFGVLNRESLTL